MLTLAKTDVTALTKTRLDRFTRDALSLSKLSLAEIRAIYPQLEIVRDALSVMLDKVDGK